jgi:hypothetical protein
METRRELQLQARRRLWFWAIFLLPFWAIGLHSTLSGDGLLGLYIALGAFGMTLFFEWLLRRFARRTHELVDQALLYDGNRLQQVAPDGTVIGEVDLAIPFSVTYPYSAAGNAVYRVAQGYGEKQTVEFSSRISGGQRLVREVLRYDEWPPGANST